MIQVKIFDYEHELSLEKAINQFLERNENIKIIDIKYEISHFYALDEQIFSYSALIIYEIS